MTKYPIEKGDYLIIRRPTWSAVFAITCVTPSQIHVAGQGAFKSGDVTVLWIPREAYGNIEPYLRKKYDNMGTVLSAIEPKRRLTEKEIVKAYQVRADRIGFKLDMVA